jgi:flavin reductase (DIM6/NTAB) family NADH-FMN oxidoreductase RutF
MTVDADGFRTALGQLASGVSVVSMRVDGEDHGFTATSVTSLSLTPMLVLVCVAHGQRCHDLLQAAGHFAVSLLHSAQTELGVRFATDPAEQRFEGLTPVRAHTGAPILPDCLAWLDCSVREILPGGDHSIVIGEVRSAGARENGLPLVYFRRQWGTFSAH